MQTPLCPGPPEESPVPCFSSLVVLLQAPSQNLSGRPRCPAASIPGLLSQACSTHTCFLLLQLLTAGVYSLGRVCSLLRKASPDSPSRTGSSFPGTSWHLKHILCIITSSLSLSHTEGKPYLHSCRYKQCPEHSG